MLKKIGLLGISLMALAVLLAGPGSDPATAQDRPQSSNYNIIPPYVAGAAPPLVMLLLARDHSLFHLAYNDTSDIDGDNRLDIGFNPSITYYGLFDSYKCYKSGTAGGKTAFVPSRTTTTGGTFGFNPKKPEQQEVNPGNLGYCGGSDEWSGNFLNYMTTNRIDALRKVLYGGRRVVDTVKSGSTPAVTVLESDGSKTGDAHNWGKEVYADETWPNYSPYYDITKYTPFAKPRNTTTKYTLAAEKPRNAPAKHFFGVYSYYLANGNVKGVSTLGVLTQQEVQPNPSYGDKSTAPTEPLIFNWMLAEGPLPRPRSELNYDALGGGTFTEYPIRVEVCKEGLIGQEKCKVYPLGSTKPIGILQKYGDDNQMFFGLMTGSYQRNQSGGVLRKNIGSMSNEIDVMGHGTVLTTSSGIIKNVDTIQISGWSHTNTMYMQNTDDSCGYLGFRSPYEGECRSWGNPIGEMMFEAIRYFNGQSAPVFGFTNSTHPVESQLSLPAWSNPYKLAELSGYDNCVKPYIMVISDVNVSFDSDQVPGSKFAPSNVPVSPSFKRLNSSVNETINTTDLLAAITEHESYYEAADGRPQNYFFGQTTPSNYDTTCTVKTLSRAAGGLAGVRGLCPGEPTRQGSYTAAAMAYFANTHNMYTGPGVDGVTVDVPNATTFAVALASPLPVIEVPVKGRPISLVPYGKTYFGSTTGFGSNASTAISYYEKDFQPTNTIVNMFIKQWDADDKGRPFAGAFDINFEFLEQGGNYDMDAIVRYSFALVRTKCPGSTSECTARKVVDKNGHIGAKNSIYYKVTDKNEMDADDVVGIWLHLRSYYAASYGQQNLGYIISGTTSDGPYLVVADYDTTSTQGKTYHLNRPDVCTGFNDTSVSCRGSATTSTNYPSGYVGVKFYGGSGSPYLESTRFFKPNLTGGSSAAKLLPNPLWLAAKYGGFTDLNGNGLPDDPQSGRGSEWDADNNGEPDTYFYVVNPSKMEEQIDKAFSAILQRSAQGSASAVSNNTLTGEGSSYKPLFYPLQTTKIGSIERELRWGGYLQALFIDKNGFYREDTVKNTVAPYNPIMDPNDLIVTFSTTTDAKVDIRFWRDPNFTGVLNNEDTSRQTNDFKDVNFIWEAGQVLSGAADGLTPLDSTTGKRNPFNSVNPQQRYLFTYADLNDDNAVAGSPAQPGGSQEVLMFDSTDSTARSALGPYLRASAVKVVGSGTNTIMFMARKEGPDGSSISVSLQNDTTLAGDVSVSVSGNTVVIKKKSNTVTAKAVVDAVNQNTAAYQMVRALLPTGDKDGNWYPAVFAAANLSYDEGVRLLMEYTIGNQVSSWRNRYFMSNNKPVTWRLGDPMNSSPIVVAAPSQNYDSLYRDLSYRAYKRAQANRRNVVFIGTNDGFLRAFNGGFPSTTANDLFTYRQQLTTETAWPLGMEIWAYIPQAVLPHLRWLIESTGFHTYMVDLTPKVIDVKTETGEWKTLLVCGLRLGGKAIDASEAFSLPSGSEPKIIRSEVFALDVTDLESPPQLLWSYTSEHLGMSTSRPSWVRLKDKWYVLFGSGPSNDLGSAAYDGLSTRKAQVILLDAVTGEQMNTWEVAEENSFLSEPSVIAAIERTVNTVTQEVEWSNPLAFFGLTYQGAGYRSSRGGIYQLATGGFESLSSWSLTPVITGVGAVSSAPAAFFTCANRLWLYFGTGRYWTTNDATPCAGQCDGLNASSSASEIQACNLCRQENINSFIGIVRSGLNDTTDVDPELQLIDTSQVLVKGDGTTAAYEVGGSTYSEAQYRALREGQLSSGIHGYRIPLPDENEIVLNRPLTVSDGDCGCLLFFTTYVPPQKICSYTGASYLYVVDCFLGTSTSRSQQFTGRDKDGVYNNRSSLGVGMPLQSSLMTIDGKLFLNNEDQFGGKRLDEISDRDSLSSGAKAWREEQRGFGEDLQATTPKP